MACQIVLNEEQRRVLQYVKTGNSIFFTGAAGSGKSTVLREIKKSYCIPGIYFTAPTGLAATNIGGITLHSFSE